MITLTAEHAKTLSEVNALLQNMSYSICEQFAMQARKGMEERHYRSWNFVSLQIPTTGAPSLFGCVVDLGCFPHSRAKRALVQLQRIQGRRAHPRRR